VRYRVLGKTGLKVSVIGFGGIKLPEISQKEADEILNRALDLGINFIDTARAYKDSETKIGKAVSKRRDEFILSSRSLSRDRDGILKDLETSMRELQTDYIDIYELHAVNDMETLEKVLAPGGALEGLKIAKQKGLIGHIGITMHFDLNAMKKAIDSNEFEVIMLAYSPLDHEGVNREGILELAKKHGMGIIIMKALLGGQLVLPETAAGLRKEDPLVRLSLKYVISNPNVDTVIPGMKKLHEIEENARVGDEPLPITEEEKKQLYELISKVAKPAERGWLAQACLQCGYCKRVCPQNIPIPEVFKAYRIYMNYPQNLKHLGLEIYKSLEVKPDTCIECKSCVQVCPIKIDIPAKLKEAQKVLEEAITSRKQ